MRFGSLFAGIGGFDVGFEQAGFSPIWQVEKEPFCIAVLKTHWPNVERYYEIKDCGHGRKHKLKSVDCITAGVPCQDVSVAGKRAGLAGERTGLFYEYVRILKDVSPTWTVFENVPGLLSSNGGKDFEEVLHQLNDAGYLMDGEILDSQFFGVAQRRRRIFLVCVRLDALLLGRTDTCGQILTSCLAQILLDAWVAFQPVWFQGLSPLASEFPAAQLADSAKARINTYATMLEKCGCLPSVNTLGEACPLYMNGLEDSVSLSSRSGKKQSRTLTPLAMKDQPEATGLDIGHWLRENLADLCFQVKSFITSISSNQTTPQAIATFANLTLSTARLMLRSMPWSSLYSMPGLSFLTVLKGPIAYAGQAVNSLFTDEHSRSFWRDYIDTADSVVREFERNTRIPCPAEVLFESEGGAGDSPQGREAGKDIAGSLGGGTYGTGRRSEDDQNFVAGPLTSHTKRHGHAMSTQQAAESGQIVATLNIGGNSDGFRTEPGEHLVAAPITASYGKQVDSSDRNGGPPNLAYCLREDPGGTGQGHNTTYAITGNMHNRSQGPANYVSSEIDPNGVRDFTELPKGMDSCRYRALGNAVTVSVANWIGQRIMNYSKGLHAD